MAKEGGEKESGLVFFHSYADLYPSPERILSCDVLPKLYVVDSLQVSPHLGEKK